VSGERGTTMTVYRRVGVAAVVLSLATVGGCAVTKANQAATTASASPIALASPSPTPTPSPTPSPGECLVGTWKQTDGTDRFKFYSNVGELTFRTKGAVRILRADGTGTFKYAKTRYESSYKGRSLALVFNGELDFKWSATESRLVYGDVTRTTVTITAYESGSKVASTKDRTGTRSIPNTYSCSTTTSKETGNTSEHHATWTRV
jgi:hypothetical protein